MPISSHLLERAYQLINAHQIQNAEMVLDAVVRVDPQNIEAWITYLQIHQNRSDLEWLRDRIIRTRELDAQVKKELLLYSEALILQLAEAEQGNTKPDTHQVFNLRTANESSLHNERVSFELLDVFNYPAVPNETPVTAKRRPRRRQWLGISLASPVSQALALLFTFFAAVRMIAVGYFPGYFLLAVFLIGCFYWLFNYKDQFPAGTITPAARMFQLDSKNKLPLTEKSIVPAKRKKAKTKKTIKA